MSHSATRSRGRSVAAVSCTTAPSTSRSPLMRRGRPLTGEHATVVALLGGNKLESSTSDSCPGEALQLDLFCCRLILKHVGRNGIIIIYLSVSIEMETERVENERNITAVDLFAGCGGMSLGFEKAGVNVVAAYDNWDAAIGVYRANFQHPVFKRDLSDVSVSEEVAGFAPDIIIGLLVRISRRPARDPRMVGAQSSLLDMPRSSRGASLASSLSKSS